MRRELFNKRGHLLLGVSSDTVYRWIDKHDMPAHKIGRLWKFKKDEIDEWVRNRGAETE